MIQDRDQRLYLSLAALGAVRVPTGTPLFDLHNPDRPPVPVIGWSEAGPVVVQRRAGDAVIGTPDPVRRGICLAEPVRYDGAPAWLDVLPWVVSRLVAAHGWSAGGPAKVRDYAAKVPSARWLPQGTQRSPRVELVADHRRLVLAWPGEPESVGVEGLIASEGDVPREPWPLGVPQLSALNRRPVVAWSADMPADAAEVVALRLSVAAAARELGLIGRRGVPAPNGEGA